MDTCAFLWFVSNNKKRLTESAISIFQDPKNDVYFSMVSAWEICIKWSIGRLELPKPPMEFILEQIKLNMLLIRSNNVRTRRKGS